MLEVGATVWIVKPPFQGLPNASGIDTQGVAGVTLGCEMTHLRCYFPGSVKPEQMKK